jgi:hypothetical protein
MEKLHAGLRQRLRRIDAAVGIHTVLHRDRQLRTGEKQKVGTLLTEQQSGGQCALASRASAICPALTLAIARSMTALRLCVGKQQLTAAC